jgi:hypothetical protein
MIEAISQVGAENLTVQEAAVSFAGRLGTNALIFVANAPIRWRADGTAPTSTTGMFVAAGDYIDWTAVHGHYKSIMDQVQFIRDTSASGDATLAIAYFE